MLDMVKPHCDHWYLAQLKPGGFGRAKLNLDRQGFANFMPMQDVTWKHSGRYIAVTRPLFQGYLFVQLLPENQNWRAVNNTYGVSRLVALEAERPTVVPSALIAGLQARCDTDGELVSAECFEVGARVRVVAGPFADTIATIDEVPDGSRVFVLMEMMGQSVRSAVSPGNLERA